MAILQAIARKQVAHLETNRCADLLGTTTGETVNKHPSVLYLSDR
jgi:hypothetical protein